MKKSNIKIVLGVILIVLIIASVGFYIADLIINKTPPTKNLFRTLAVVFACIASIIRLWANKGRRNLAAYESAYQKHIKNAFANSPLYKKKLLCAIRLYDEGKCDKAINKYLVALKGVSQTRDDIYAVGLITGLALTELKCYDEAINVYNSLIEMNIASSTIYGNLGNIYLTLGNQQDAISYIRLAIQNDENNPAPYNNLANLYFEISDFENAKIYAKKALELNHKMYQASTLLAIIYTLEGDKANAEKYSHMAIASGRPAAELNKVIAHYVAEKQQNHDEE